jgi:hypothetical protein
VARGRFVWEEGDLQLVETGDMRLFDEKWRFIHAQILASCVAASFQRAHVYADEALARDRARLHTDLRAELKRIGEQYATLVKGPDHVQNIVELAARISESSRPALAGGRFRLGIAQKALNLYLKYLWCLRRIPTPPHCPFDRLIIARLRECNDVSWTRLDSKTDYEKLVAAAERAADGKSIAEWELGAYNLASSGA